jgi:hypothetical protein
MSMKVVIMVQITKKERSQKRYRRRSSLQYSYLNCINKHDILPYVIFLISIDYNSNAHMIASLGTND